MIIDPVKLDRRSRNGLMNGLVAPRPIAWVSSLAPDGARNLAPFSFFGAFSFDPPTVGLGPGSRQGTNKDSLRNIKATGEFVVNLVDRELAEVANACSGEFPPEIDEWDIAGVDGAPSEFVAPDRVAAAPAALECRVRQVLELGDADRASNNLVVAWVVRIHVRDDAMDGIVPRPDVLDLVGRLGGDEWCTTRDRFTLARPKSTDPAQIVGALELSRETRRSARGAP
jgi:flavin reductase (DIM6/NTAB) family NADH-FMN oxidoreductase RutF